MEIEVLELKERSMKFILKNSTPALANALRRTIISDIPKLAIDEVEFMLGPSSIGLEMNSNEKEADSKTPLFNEIIAHRLGQIPLPTDLGLMVPRDKCTCGGVGCPSCRVTYFLSKRGPCTVYSGELMPLGDEKYTEALKPVDKKIPIVELAENESIMLNAYAYIGTAKKHVKWQTACGVGYTYRPVVKITGKVTDPEGLCKACPKKVFGLVDGKLEVVNEIACSLCNTCREGDFKKDGISVNGDDTSFLFTFETDGSLTAQQVLDKAVEVLSSEAADIAKTVAAF